MNRTVAEALKEKHLPRTKAQEEAMLPEPPTGLPPKPTHIFMEREVRETTAEMQGAGGPSGTRVDAVAERDMLLRYGDASTALREEVAVFTERVTNKTVEWRGIVGMLVQLEVALRKEDGEVRPIGMKEVLM
eukprot:Cvel_4930.t1-p1 / transcript=Cvel_4930.t1 / gene=Cvel_4930 / organism=Chromera_velia_CCMP2878 / gene_product=hypothetical protein / transcript_product=hypothetical protein / location=Cvel_scaffold223:503-897(-) / protein_length=131 / sequence_SO=supercontig / SO=protein_coding / is_pseudo=false